MEDYIQTSTTAMKGLSYLNYFYYDEEVSGDLALMYEPKNQDTPPLACACKSIFHEFKPSAGRDVRFVVEGDIRDDDLWANTKDITLPVRCQDMSVIRHLHLELHLDDRSGRLWAGLGPPPKGSAPGPFRRLMQILSNTNGGLRSVHTITLALSSLFRELGPDIETSWAASVHNNFMMANVEPWLQVLVAFAEICPGLARLRAVEVFREKWLNILGEKMAARGAKLVRGKPSQITPGYEVCE